MEETTSRTSSCYYQSFSGQSPSLLDPAFLKSWILFKLFQFINADIVQLCGLLVALLAVLVGTVGVFVSIAFALVEGWKGIRTRLKRDAAATTATTTTAAPSDTIVADLTREFARTFAKMTESLDRHTIELERANIETIILRDMLKDRENRSPQGKSKAVD